jgi:hypothetical protein
MAIKILFHLCGFLQDGKRSTARRVASSVFNKTNSSFLIRHVVKRISPFVFLPLSATQSIVTSSNESLMHRFPPSTLSTSTRASR